ncbi:MAG: VgrG-related protein, partial [Dehalococcoidia bacterium]|nr:VgrG-related protein [Dehalococcoidia bacterium]
MPGAVDLISHVYLKIGAARLTEEMMSDVLNIEVDDSLRLPDMFSIRLRDSNLKWVKSSFFELGKKVEISVKTQQGVTKLMDGEITAVDLEARHPMPTLLIRGYDQSHRLNRDRKTRTYISETDSGIAEKIARDNGLGVQAEATGGPPYQHIVQRNQTDWEFLWERARRIGYRVYIEDRTLYFRQKPNESRVPKLEWGIDLQDFRASLSTAEQVTEIQVRGWDPVRKQSILGRATRARVDLDIGERRQGGQATQQAFSQQPKLIVVDQPVSSQAEADALAQGMLDDVGNAFLQADGVCAGNPAVAAGAKVELAGLGQRFSGRYLITHSLHRYSLQGYSTHFTVSGHRAATLTELLRPPDNGGSHSVVVAIVTNNKDPQNLGRVKLKYPWLSDKDESDWARLALPGAGKDRGVSWVPDIGDEVLVAFGHGDINIPYVLGGLWSRPAGFPVQNIDSIVDGQGKVMHHSISVGDFHIEISEEPGNEWIGIRDDNSRQQIRIDRSQNKIELTTQGDVKIAGNNIQ